MVGRPDFYCPFYNGWPNGQYTVVSVVSQAKVFFETHV